MLRSEAPVMDQAEGLRRLVSAPPVRVIAVTSGKGGVGKTNVSVNLALALRLLGREVMLLDADLGLANVDVLLGLNAPYNLSHVIKGERTLEEVVVEGPQGLKIVPASSGIRGMTELGPMGHASIIRAFSELVTNVEALVIDTAAGINEGVLTFAAAAQEVLVVVCDEPASITDAYALIKVLSRDHGLGRFRVLASQARDAREGEELYRKLVTVTDRFLSVALHYAGAIPRDDNLRRAVRMQRAVVDAFPGSPSALAFKNLARSADNWPVPQAGGKLEFFAERLMRGRMAEEALL